MSPADTSTITPGHRTLILTAGVTVPSIPHLLCEAPGHDTGYVLLLAFFALLGMLAVLRYLSSPHWINGLRHIEVQVPDRLTPLWMAQITIYMICVGFDTEYGYRTALCHAAPIFALLLFVILEHVYRRKQSRHA